MSLNIGLKNQKRKKVINDDNSEKETKKLIFTTPAYPADNSDQSGILNISE